MNVGDRVLVKLQPRSVRLTNDRRETRWRREFAARVNGQSGVVVGFSYNLVNPISVNVDGWGLAQFSAVDLEVVS